MFPPFSVNFMRLLQILERWPFVLISFAPLFWAGNAVVGRAVVGEIPPLTLAFWRWSCALLILLPAARPFIGRDWLVVKAHWRILLLLSFLGIACFNTLLYVGLQTTTSINAALLQAAMPAFIGLLTGLFWGEKLSLAQWGGIALTIVGVGVIVLPDGWQTVQKLSFVVGDGLILGAVILYALYSVLLRYRPAVHFLTFLTVTFAGGALLLLPLYLWELTYAPLPSVNSTLFFTLLYVSLFPSIVSYFCWNRGIELLGAHQGGLFINLVPVFATIFSVLFLDEEIRLAHGVGMALILGGLLWFSWLRRPGKTLP